MAVRYSDARTLSADAAVSLYRSVGWSSAEKPEQLYRALMECHALITAWDGERLVGAGYAISDGHLVVYYPHLVVDPEYQGRGIGTGIMTRLMDRYRGFHQHTLIADGRTLEFYRRLGFTRAGVTEPMWIFDGDEH